MTADGPGRLAGAGALPIAPPGCLWLEAPHPEPGRARGRLCLRPGERLGGHALRDLREG